MSGVLLAWHAFLPKPKLALRLFWFEVGFTSFWLVAVYYMGFVDRAFPFKYDTILEGLDARWLFDAAVCRRLIESSPGLREATDATYLGLKNVVIFWYGWHAATDSRPKRFLLSLLLAYAVGPLFYMLVPAYGPHILTGKLPNCMPSLHMATALLMVAYRPKGGLIPALVFTIATAFVTLATGQHYVIDLVAALPFFGFVWAVMERRWIVAGCMLATVTCFVMAIHLLA
jgi:hypothetical protein